MTQESAPAAEPAPTAATTSPGEAAPGARTAPPPEAPTSRLPVKVRYIGMHIGGGPNDPKTKAPFERALASSLEDLGGCYAALPSRREGTLGVDLLVPRQGGEADVTNARTALGDATFRECAVRVFAGVRFEPPRAPTKLSYSVRFEP